MQVAADLTVHVGLKNACRAFGLNRGFVYRDRARHLGAAPRCEPPRLSRRLHPLRGWTNGNDTDMVSG